MRRPKRAIVEQAEEEVYFRLSEWEIPQANSANNTFIAEPTQSEVIINLSVLMKFGDAHSAPKGIYISSSVAAES